MPSSAYTTELSDGALGGATMCPFQYEKGGPVEHIIAQLLQDFEHGRLTRRQLIQTLALGATAASAIGVAPAAAAEGQTFKAVAVNHISYQVADYTKTRDFYTSLLGMKATQDN